MHLIISVQPCFQLCRPLVIELMSTFVFSGVPENSETELFAMD